MFERPHHQRIAHVLAALDGALLRERGCLFGGGTCIALRFGEYRESVGVDFLVSDADGYRDLRQLLTGPLGLNAIVRKARIALERPTHERYVTGSGWAEARHPSFRSVNTILGNLKTAISGAYHSINHSKYDNQYWAEFSTALTVDLT